MAEQLKVAPDPRFIDHALRRLPSPPHPETGLVVPGGITLQGAQDRILKSRARYRQVRGGIRAGKSFVAALALYLDMAWMELESGNPDILYGVIGDTYKMAEEEMRHLHWLLEVQGIPHTFHTPQNQSWKITFTHKKCEVITLTAADVTKIASRAYRGIVLAEAAQLPYEAWLNARGRVLQTRGWVLIEGTFEAAGAWFYDMAEEWERDGAEGETFPLATWENLAAFPGGRNDPAMLEAERDWPPDLFMERLGGIATKRSDRVMRYADAKVHVRHRFPNLGTSFDEELPVVLFIDPGSAHAYAVIAAQFHKPTPAHNWDTWFIDSIYRWGRTTDQIVEECSQKPWAKNVGEAVMDFAGRQVRSEGPPNIEQWVKGWRDKMGANLFIHAEPVPLAQGYDVHKRLLLNGWPEEEAQRRFNHDKQLRRVTAEEGPRLFIDPLAAPPFFGGIVDGQRYRGEYNLHRHKKNREGTVIRDDPIDMDNDAIKAANYGLYWRYGAFGDRTKLLGFGSIPWELRAG